jgi:hypothetical protein
MKRWRIHFKSKDGDQVMTLLAETRQEAERAALAAQRQRHQRFPLTFARMEQNLTGDALKAEMEKRKRDLERYDADTLKIESVKEIPL